MDDLSNAMQLRSAQISEARLIAKRAAMTAYRQTRRAQMAQTAIKQSFTVADPGSSAAYAQGTLSVYTDGACEPNPGRGGWGFVVYQGGVEVHTGYGGEFNTTNNRMEFAGILNALKWLDGKTATIHTDSQYCLNALTLWHTKWAANGWRKGAKKTAEPVKNAELIRACLAVKQSGHTLQWCKGHAGIAGNERADRLAALGRSIVQAPTKARILEHVPRSAHDRPILTLPKKADRDDCGCDAPPWEDCTDGMTDGDREALRAGSDQISMWQQN
jgi:ribonuclease HI